MERRSSAYYQRRHRERLRDKGLVKKELWVLPEFADELLVVEKRMRQPRGAAPGRGRVERAMSDAKVWTAEGLFDALAQADEFVYGESHIELIDGAQASLHLVMGDYGDLPLFLAVVGEQIVVEALLWPVSHVRDAAAFNEEVLRTHKVIFPLSTIGIETLADGESVYMMFGSLSAASSLSNVLYEIETLADNVIKATEAYEQLLLEAA